MKLTDRLAQRMRIERCLERERCFNGLGRRAIDGAWRAEGKQRRGRPVAELGLPVTGRGRGIAVAV